MPSLIDIVARNLQLIRSRTPSGAEAQTWVDEFNRQIGSIDAERLQSAFDAARTDAAGTARYRPRHFDDILHAYRRTPGTGESPDGAPEDPDCPRQCDRGRVMVLEAGAAGTEYPCLVICDCSAGAYWATRAGWIGQPTVTQVLRRSGYRLKPASSLPRGHAEWLHKETLRRGLRPALEHYDAEMARRAARDAGG